MNTGFQYQSLLYQLCSLSDRLSTNWYVAVFLALGLSVLAFTVTYRKGQLQQIRKSISNRVAVLEVENENLRSENTTLKQNTPQLCYTILRDISKTHFHFHTSPPYAERISLYIHDSISGFQMIARSSMNPQLETIGRRWYPDNQGLISHAWKNGITVAAMPKGDAEWSRKCVSKYSMEKEVADNISMKSVMYGVIRINNKAGDPLAVVVVESMNRKYTITDLRKLLNTTFGDGDHNLVKNQLIELIETHRPWLGNLTSAQERGL